MALRARRVATRLGATLAASSLAIGIASQSAAGVVGQPPGAPTGVVGLASDASAAVSWTAPTNAGSYPITHYQVTSSPGSRTCLVSAPETACTVNGLANGTSYTFTARALNGAGWGADSLPSEAVTPSKPVTPAMLITGSRDATDPRIVRVSGRSRGLTGQLVTPYVRFPGQPEYDAGLARPAVADDGTFTWQRQSSRKMYVYFTTREVMSNRLIIRAR